MLSSLLRNTVCNLRGPNEKKLRMYLIIIFSDIWDSMYASCSIEICDKVYVILISILIKLVVAYLILFFHDYVCYGLYCATIEWR